MSSNNQRTTKLRTFDDVVWALGGMKVVSRMTGRSIACICNWRAKRGHFPAKFYKSMTELLTKEGLTASPALWGQIELKKVRPWPNEKAHEQRRAPMRSSAVVSAPAGSR